jgi:thiol-disulfide isomerase/thioredoxin
LNTVVDASPGAIYSIRFSGLDGKQHELGEWQHKLLVINFWATWCDPCKEEMPLLAKLQAEFGSRNLQIVGIAVDSTLNVANFAKKYPTGYPLLPDEPRAIEFSKRLGNRLGLLPYTIVLKPGGQPIFSRLGVVTEGEMRELFAKNL